MGKRSRSKQQEAKEARQTQRAELGQKSWRERMSAAADAAAERSKRERPAAPWDPFPLSELLIFIGILFIGAGMVVGLRSGQGQMVGAVGLAIACLGALENVIREHFAGFRSHAGLLAGVAALVAIGIAANTGASVPLRIGISLAVGAFAYFPLRRAFLARSGGRRL